MESRYLETVRRRVAQGTRSAGLIARALGLGIVFDHFQSMAAGDGQDGIHVGRLSVKMHRDNRPGPGRDGGCNPFGVEVKGVWVGFHRHWHGARIRNREPGSDVGVRRHDDFITRANTISAQDQMQCFQSVADANAVRHAAIRGELPLEGFHLTSQDILGRAHETEVSFIQLRLKFFIGSGKIEKRNFHALAPPTSRRNSG